MYLKLPFFFLLLPPSCCPGCGVPCAWLSAILTDFTDTIIDKNQNFNMVLSDITIYWWNRVFLKCYYNGLTKISLRISRSIITERIIIVKCWFIWSKKQYLPKYRSDASSASVLLDGSASKNTRCRHKPTQFPPCVWK